MKNAIQILIFCSLFVVAQPRLLAQRLDPVQQTIEGMTLREKAARLLIVGVDGTSLNGASGGASVSASGSANTIIRDVSEHGVSGVIFFEKNLAPSTDRESGQERLRRFVADIQSHASHTLLMAIDQEGGAVNRLKTKYGFAPQPSHAAVGAADGAEAARAAAATIASALSGVGLNLNFAPCVDVNVNPACPIVGGVGRSFSDDERRVSELAEIYCEEHRREGILTALKHFPGHGSSLVDSHLGFTDITNTWQQRELIPYFDLVRSEACDMVMVSHLYNRDLDPTYPATLSSKTIEWLLRSVIGWQGVVVSDDMQMRAIVDHYGFEQSVVLGVNAGVDLFIISGNIRRESFDITERFIDAVVDAVARGELSEQRIDKSLRRILTLVNGLE